YHAFLAARRLDGLVPPLLGLRDGLLYTEWFPQPEGAEEDRGRQVAAAASYVAARVRGLGLGEDPTPTLGLNAQHDAFELLEKVLSKASPGTAAAPRMRRRVRHRLAGLPCPVPPLIDGRMRRPEWVAGPAGLLKTDFEHHGLGKNELNVVDPAYDLADAVL